MTDHFDIALHEALCDSATSGPTAKLYAYTWGNNEKRATMKGRICRMLARGVLNSALIEFVDNGEQVVVSRNALRRAK